MQLSCDNLKEAVRLAPKEFAYHLKYGQMLTRLDKMDQALDQFRQAIKLNASDAIAHRDYGACLGLKKDYAGEIAEEEKAIGLKSDDGDSYYYLGSAYSLLGKRTEAQTNLLRCVELDKKNADAYSILSGIACANDQFKEAIKYAETAANLEPGNTQYATALRKIKEASTLGTSAKNPGAGKGSKAQ